MAVNINESTQGDFFEIYGTYNGDILDYFIADLKAKGKSSIRIDYIVSLFEENILQRTQTISVYENFSEVQIYGPVIMTSNTTAAIDVEMDIVDLVDSSIIARFTSIGLTSEIFKYGRNLTRINMDNVYKPIIYVPKQGNTTINQSSTSPSTSPNINITKVNYPLLYDKYKIMVGSTGSNNSGFQSNGLLNIVITPFDNVMKFYITINTNGSATPYDLTDILSNATMLLVFRSDTDYLQEEIWYESGGNNGNDYTNGILVFKISETDINTIKKIQTNNNNFYLLLNSLNTNTLFYSGKFTLYENLTFIAQPASVSPITIPSSNPITTNLTPSISQITTPSKNITLNKIIVFIKTYRVPTTAPTASVIQTPVDLGNIGEFTVISTQYDVDAWQTMQSKFSLTSSLNGKVVAKFNKNGLLIGYYNVGDKIQKYDIADIALTNYGGAGQGKIGTSKVYSLTSTNSNDTEWIRTDSIQTSIVQSYIVKSKDNSGYASVYEGTMSNNLLVLTIENNTIADNTNVSIYDDLTYSGVEYVKIKKGNGKIGSYDTWIKKSDISVISPVANNITSVTNASSVASITTNLADLQMNTTVITKTSFELWLISQGIKYKKIYANAFSCTDTTTAQRNTILKRTEVDTIFDVSDDNVSTAYITNIISNPTSVNSKFNNVI